MNLRAKQQLCFNCKSQNLTFQTANFSLNLPDKNSILLRVTKSAAKAKDLPLMTAFSHYLSGPVILSDYI